jgi:hypothetical protein
MAWRIVKQPNGLYARWSDIVDMFTDMNMTRAQALKRVRQYFEERGQDYSEEDVEAKVALADVEGGWKNEPRPALARWQECRAALRMLRKHDEGDEIIRINETTERTVL